MHAHTNEWIYFVKDSLHPLHPTNWRPKPSKCGKNHVISITCIQKWRTAIAII